MVTVPTFGFGIRPRGPSTLPRRPTSGIMSAGIIHAGIGKVSFDDQKIVENIRAFADAVAKAKRWM
jgi:hypothetical protein